jgi:hypothetical protein
MTHEELNMALREAWEKHDGKTIEIKEGEPTFDASNFIESLSHTEGGSVILHCNASGCLASIVVLEHTAPGATYTCRRHTPVGENDIHFQPCQFYPEIGSGTDPRAYETRKDSKKASTGGHYGRPRKKRLAEIKELLKGHENADEILNILKVEIRDSNS